MTDKLPEFYVLAILSWHGWALEQVSWVDNTVAHYSKVACT